MAPSHRQPQSGQEAPPRIRPQALNHLWERQRRDYGAKSATTSVGAGSPSHESSSRLPVGAATPRLWRQVIDNLSQGSKPLPRIRPQALNHLWERQRRDYGAKSATTSVGAGSPSHEFGLRPRITCGSGNAATTAPSHRHPSRGSKPLPQIQFATPCGSGNAATPAPNQPHPQSGHEAPPTNAVGADTSDLLHGGDRDVRHLTPAADPPLFSCRLSFSSAH